MANPKENIVRLVRPSSQPVLPKKTTHSANLRKKREIILPKSVNILIGSGIGCAAGLIIHLMLKSTGVNFGGVESSIVIGLPAILGILTSLVVF
jgi:hypothetical protein